jgi:hypothetical protein
VKLIPFTRPDGSTIHVGDGTIVEPVTSGDGAAPKSRTRIFIGGVSRFVTEDPDEVVKRLLEL